MIEKRTVFSRAECTAIGTLQIRLEKQMVENGVVLAKGYHRTVIEPGDDVDAQIARVNAHLVLMGCQPIDAEAVTRIKRLATAEHTADRVTAFRSTTEQQETVATETRR